MRLPSAPYCSSANWNVSTPTPAPIVREVLESTARRIRAPGKHPYVQDTATLRWRSDAVGHGCVDAAAAVKLALELRGPVLAQP